MLRSMRARLLLAIILAIIAAGAAASAVGGEILGVGPEDQVYYKGTVIRCRDGSGKFDRERLNDGYCDCPDGTDEPGTSACPEGKFYCKNVGHVPATIFSSRVNDGICDCCDGSDEYGGTISCQNTCWLAGKAARDKLKNKIATYQEGSIIRSKEIEKANEAFAKDEAELSKLKTDEKMLKSLVDKLKEQKERIEKMEEEVRLKKEKEEKQLKEEAEKALEGVKDSEVSHEIYSDDINKVPPKEEQKQDQEDDHAAEVEHNTDHKIADEHTEPSKSRIAEDRDESSSAVDPEKDDDLIKTSSRDDSSNKEAPLTSDIKDHSSHEAEGLSREELGRLVASRWTGEKVGEAEETTIGNVHDDDPAEVADEGYLGYNSEVEDDRYKYDDDDDAYSEDDIDEEYAQDKIDPPNSYQTDEEKEAHRSGRMAWLDKLQQTVKNVFKAFNFFKTPVNISEASHVRKEYGDASSKLSKIQSRISALTEKLKHDFGKQKEFYSFYDQCFENKEGKYVYKVCPYKKASQVEGHSNTNLGHWDKFEASSRIMLFSGGDRCWNGPDRSLKVRLRCGLKDELTDVDEPSRCEYVAVLSTPAVCTEDKLKELQGKLDRLSKNEPTLHDEL